MDTAITCTLCIPFLDIDNDYTMKQTVAIDRQAIDHK